MVVSGPELSLRVCAEREVCEQARNLRFDVVSIKAACHDEADIWHQRGYRFETLTRKQNVEFLAMASARVNEHVIGDGFVLLEILSNPLRVPSDGFQGIWLGRNRDDLATELRRRLVASQGLDVGPWRIELEAIAVRSSHLLCLAQVLVEVASGQWREVQDVEHVPMRSENALQNLWSRISVGPAIRIPLSRVAAHACANH